MKVLLFDNPNGYAFLFLSKMDVEYFEVHVIADFRNIYNANWPNVDNCHLYLYKKYDIIFGVELVEGGFLGRDFFRQFDKIVSFTYSGSLFLWGNRLKFIYYNIGGFKDFYRGYLNYANFFKFAYKFIGSIVFKVILFRAEIIIVSSKMDFDHVFNSIFSSKIRFLPLFVPKWEIYVPAYSDVINFVHFSAQSHRLKNNPAIFAALSILKDQGVQFRLHLFLWGIHVKETLDIINESNFKGDIIINNRLSVVELNAYVISLPRLFVLGEFSDYVGPGSGGAIREAASAGIPCISYVRNDDYVVEPTTMFINSNAKTLSQVLLECSVYGEVEYYELCKFILKEFNLFYNDFETNEILFDLLNEGL